MAYLNKEYKFAEQDNFDGFLRSAGLPEDQVQKYLQYKPTSKLLKDGDTYTYISGTPDGVKETTFKSGVEFEDNIQGIPIKTKYTVDGNSVKQEIKTDKGTAYFNREYKGDELLVTLTSTAWDGVAKRTYKA